MVECYIELDHLPVTNLETGNKGNTEERQTDRQTDKDRETDRQRQRDRQGQREMTHESTAT